MARIRDGRARADGAARARSAGRVLGFWLLFALAGWLGIHGVDRLVAGFTRGFAGGRDDVAGLSGRWAGAGLRADVSAAGGRLTLLLDADGTGGTVRHEAFALAAQPEGMFQSDPVFTSTGDPRVEVRLIGATMRLDVSGTYAAGLPPHAELRRVGN